MLHISLLVMNRLNKTEYAIFISLILSLLQKDLTNQNLFPSFLLHCLNSGIVCVHVCYFLSLFNMVSLQ